MATMTVEKALATWEIREVTFGPNAGKLHVSGKKVGPQDVAWLKEHKDEVLVAIRAREARKAAEAAARREAEKAAKEAAKEEIRSGRKVITLRFKDGEYLSGYCVGGVVAELLEELGLTKYVDGWGDFVRSEVVEALGESFTYAEAAEFARPSLEAEAAAKAKREAEVAAKFDEAKATGQPVALAQWAAECDGSVLDCSIDIYYRYAMPDGSTKVERTHTY